MEDELKDKMVDQTPGADPQPITAADPAPATDPTPAQQPKPIVAPTPAADPQPTEAEKLKELTAAEQLAKLQSEVEALKKKDAYNGLAAEAGNSLQGLGIMPTPEILGFVVKDTAEATAAAVKSFAEAVSKAAADTTKTLLMGTPPKALSSVGVDKPTKEEIMEIKDPVKRQRLIRENLELFEQKK